MKTTKLSLRIIALFTVAIFMTFIPENFREFFGDWKCIGSGGSDSSIYNPIYKNCNYAECGYHDATWHYGYRHWIFITMGCLLFFIQASSIIEKWNHK